MVTIQRQISKMVVAPHNIQTYSDTILMVIIGRKCSLNRHGYQGPGIPTRQLCIMYVCVIIFMIKLHERNGLFSLGFNVCLWRIAS